MSLAGNFDRFNLSISDSAAEAGRQAALRAAACIKDAIYRHDQANIVLATGASQFAVLENLVLQDIEWNKVVMFHLDEYIGLPITSPASFRNYLQERFVSKVAPLKSAYFINGEHDPAAECRTLSAIIREHPIHVALVGIGENGHLAFNDPPADFETEEPYLVVYLDERCRLQQMGEGWFKTMDDVPKQAISMSIKQICLAQHIICTVPDDRKSEAVFNSILGPVTNMVPASILQQHPDCWYFLDKFSSAKLHL